MRARGAAGLGIGVVAGSAFGGATVLARALARANVSDATVLSLRFGIAALLLAAFVLGTRGSLRPARGEVIPVLLLGFLGYGCVAACFFTALQHGSAGGVTVVFYAYPALVAVVEIVGGRAARQWSVAVGLGTAAVGVGCVVLGAGARLSGSGAAFAFVAAAAFAAYLTIGDRVVRHTPTAVRAFWTAAGAAAFGLAFAATGSRLALPVAQVPVAIGAGAATAAAFVLLFLALRRLGPTSTAVVLNVEAVAAVGLGAVLLGESVSATELVGALLVVGAAVWTTATVPGTQSASSRTRG